MGRANVATVDAYIAAQPEPLRPVLDRLRRALRRALPAAEEAISYGMPVYRLGRRRVIFFAGWKEHIALYPATPHVVASLAAELAPYVVSKNTIRFPLDRPVPYALAGRIARLRAAEVAEAPAPRRARKRA